MKFWKSWAKKALLRSLNMNCLSPNLFYVTESFPLSSSIWTCVITAQICFVLNSVDIHTQLCSTVYTGMALKQVRHVAEEKADTTVGIPLENNSGVTDFSTWIYCGRQAGTHAGKPKCFLKSAASAVHTHKHRGPVSVSGPNAQPQTHTITQQKVSTGVRVATLHSLTTGSKSTCGSEPGQTARVAIKCVWVVMIDSLKVRQMKA